MRPTHRTRARLLAFLIIAGSLSTAVAADRDTASWAKVRPATLAAALPAATPGPQNPLPAFFDSLDEALRAALAAYVQHAAPGLRFRLGEARQAGEFAYAVAQEVDARGLPAREHAVALLARWQAGKGWRALAPRVGPSQEYNALLSAFPAELLDETDKAYFHQAEAVVAQANLTGHRLPWPAGQIAYVTQVDEPYHMSQVDFDVRGLAAAGDVYATKPGRVAFVKECSNTGGCDYAMHGKANVVVIEHGPGEYSWYLHLACNSVPVSVGDWVGFGSKIGVEGNTGYSCPDGDGIHLHYMASNAVPTAWPDPNNPDLSPWPPAESITAVDFHEVPWSGLQVMHTYVSANAPQASLTPRCWLPLVEVSE